MNSPEVLILILCLHRRLRLRGCWRVLAITAALLILIAMATTSKVEAELQAYVTEKDLNRIFVACIEQMLMDKPTNRA